mmetsp:Transcript_3590/g.10224  ORF Transcript_3590/g.10224 Transcript_3590/m.10224 type:complete len:245 (+) Transcript_3590:311-1045(+)
MRVPQTLVREFESSHIMPGLMIPMPGAAFRALRNGIKHGFHLPARTFAHFFGGFLAVKEQVLVPHHQPGELDVHVGLVPLAPHVDDGRVVSGRPFTTKPNHCPRLHDGVRAALGLAVPELRGVLHTAHAPHPRERVLDHDHGQDTVDIDALQALRRVLPAPVHGVVLPPRHLQQKRTTIVAPRHLHLGHDADLRLVGVVLIYFYVRLRGARVRKIAVQPQQLHQKIRARVEEARHGRPAPRPLS